LLNWPKLKPEQKRTLYAKHASHELHFFLAKKDPAFFQAAVRPFLANKKDKTFMDHWLLEDDLGQYLEPWWYGRLNTVERVLLAQRLRDEPARTARDLADRLRLQPPNIDHLLSLFDTAVKGGALDAEDALGLRSATRRATPTRGLMPMKDAAKPEAAPPPAAGLMGGERAGATVGEDKAANKEEKEHAGLARRQQQSKDVQ